MRRRRAEKREISADPKYNNQMVARFINVIMIEGKKSVAENIVYGAIDALSERVTDEPGVKVFVKAIENVKPRLELKARRVGGSTYQVPIEVAPNRANSLAMRWIRDFAQKKKGKSMRMKLADELLAAYRNEGPAIKKRDETHKMADANKAYAHLRW